MPLTDNLIEYWELNETSGDRTGAHASIVLTDVATVGSTTGKVGNAADFVRANNEQLTKTDDATIGLSTDTPFTWAFWARLDTDPGTGVSIIIVKLQESGNFPAEYSIRYDHDNTRFRFTVEIDNTPTGTTLNVTQTLTVSQWYFLVFWHDPTADTLNCQIDNGTPSSTAHSLGTGDFPGPLRVGSENASPTSGWDGPIDQLGFWHRVLTSDERTALYNSGNGLSYAAMGGAFEPAQAVTVLTGQGTRLGFTINMPDEV